MLPQAVARRKIVSDRFAVIMPIGREILTGRILDTNSQWLAQRLFERGVRVARITTSDDQVEAVAREVRRARMDGASILLTTGGLGPTPDDITLFGVAKGLGRPCVIVPLALEHVRARYAQLYREGRVDSPDLNPDRQKMAFMPRGAAIIENPVGTAPGAELHVGRLSVFCLPGVPAEMKAMAEAGVFPKVKGEGVLVRLSIEVKTRDESSLAAVIRALQPAFPDVHFKPDPKGFGKERVMVVHLESRAADRQTGDARLREAADALAGAL